MKEEEKVMRGSGQKKGMSRKGLNTEREERLRKEDKQRGRQRKIKRNEKEKATKKGRKAMENLERKARYNMRI